jgi:predicted dehydrogenase
MGCNYAKMISQGLTQGIEITAVTRITEERKEALREIFDKGAMIFQTAKELFDAVRAGKVEVDAALIVTPHLSHAELAVEAMELGLSVLCDKPAGAYSRQARQMREAAENHENLVFGMMFNQRMNPRHQKIREIVQSGRYGQMKRVSWTITDWYRPDGYYAAGAWRGTWEGEGGGILLNQCPHNLDLLQWICGMPVSVQAFCNEGKYHDIAVEDEVTAYFTYENGATGTFYSTTGEASGINRLEIAMEDALLVYEKGEIKVRELKVHEAEYRKTATDFFAQPEGEWKTIQWEGTDMAHAGILQNFAELCSKSES